MLEDRIPRFGAHRRHFFAKFDWFVVLMSRLDTYISRYGDFWTNNDNNDNKRRHNRIYFTPCACARGNYYSGVVMQIINVVSPSIAFLHVCKLFNNEIFTINSTHWHNKTSLNTRQTFLFYCWLQLLECLPLPVMHCTLIPLNVPIHLLQSLLYPPPLLAVGGCFQVIFKLRFLL